MYIKGKIGDIINYLYDNGVGQVTLIEDRLMFRFGGKPFDISLDNIFSVEEFEDTLKEIIDRECR